MPSGLLIIYIYVFINNQSVIKVNKCLFSIYFRDDLPRTWVIIIIYFIFCFNIAIIMIMSHYWQTVLKHLYVAKNVNQSLLT